MLRIPLFFISLFSMLVMNGQNLKEYRWEKRILVIEATSPSDLDYQNQLKSFENSRAELIDRKLILFEFIGDQYKCTDYSLDNPNFEWKEIKGKQNKYLKNSDKFNVTLIGLDGGTKVQQDKPLSKKELFALIDVMPMRKWELKNR